MDIELAWHGDGVHKAVLGAVHETGDVKHKAQTEWSATIVRERPRL
jgi:hypothetical protein